jgi:hypothetical protein
VGKRCGARPSGPNIMGRQAIAACLAGAQMDRRPLGVGFLAHSQDRVYRRPGNWESRLGLGLFISYMEGPGQRLGRFFVARQRRTVRRFSPTSIVRLCSQQCKFHWRICGILFPIRLAD